MDYEIITYQQSDDPWFHGPFVPSESVPGHALDAVVHEMIVTQPPVVPAPGTGIILLAAALVACRRRHRRAR